MRDNDAEAYNSIAVRYMDTDNMPSFYIPQQARLE